MERRTPKNITNDCATSVQITAFMPPFQRKNVKMQKRMRKAQYKTYDTCIKGTNDST